jgi:putative ABC transport system permease protein
VVLAIDLANESARRGFALFAETLAGRATHQVLGGPGGLDEAVYRRLRLEAGVRQAAPVVERDVALVDRPGVVLHLLGVDPFAEPPFRSFAGASGAGEGGLGPLLTRPGSVVLARGTLERLGLRVGDTVVLRAGAARRPVTVVGALRPRDAASARALESLLIADVATAQELLGTAGRLSRVDLIAPAGARGEALLARVRALLPPDARIEPAGVRASSLDRLTRAFRLNLSALSLLALIVGLFLVYNAMTFSVVARRELFGVLRALGVSRREILALVLGEALLLGVVATAAGLPLGIVLGQGLVRLVARTINDLYVTLTVSALVVPGPSLARAAAIGLCGTLVATLPAALEATATRPRLVLMRSAIEARARRAAPRLALAGIAVIAAGVGVLALETPGLVAAYAALFAGLLGAALLTPAATVVLIRALGPVAGWLLGLQGRLAAAAVVQALSRTAVALGALMIAIAATVGVGIMIQSFRGAVEGWLATSLPADVYVTTPATVSSRAEVTLDPALVARVRATPGVARVGALRVVRVESGVGPVQLLALDADDRGWAAFALVTGDAEAVRRGVREGPGAMVSEPFARRHRLGAGSRLALVTPAGVRAVPVVAVYRDYGSSEGAVLVSRATYDRAWDDRGVTSLGVYAAPGVEVEALIAALRAAAGPGMDLVIRSNRALREASLQVFDQTFAVTVVLRYLAMAVAFIGVLSALTAVLLERGREVAVLRAQGLTAREVWGLAAAQSALMGLVAGLLALPVGVGLAVVLVRVINERSFGWTIPLQVGPGVLAQALLLAVAAAVLAGVYPAYRMSRLPLPDALRDE